MKKLLILIAFLVSTMPAFCSELIDGLYYNLDKSNHTAEVTYKYTSFNSSYVAGYLTIPESVSYQGTSYSVTEIGDWAFRSCSGLTSVIIPNSVTSIGGSAFEYCSGLTSVIIPNSVTSIGGSAFYGCSGLTNLIFNAENCTVCGSTNNPAFPSNITSLTIGEKVKEIPDNAFYGITNMTSVKIPNSVTSIGVLAFSGCSGLTSVEIGNSVTSIGNSAFYYCSGLKSVVIPNSVTSIGQATFRNCPGLTSVEIGNSVTSIGVDAFYLCSGLTNVEISDVAAWCGISFGNLSANPLYYAEYLYLNGKLVTKVEIPDSVTSIGSYVFYDYSLLTSVTIPNSVTSIEESAFKGCPIENLNIDCPTIGNWFSKFETLKYLEIGNSVTSIGDSAFRGCTGLSNLIFNAENCTVCGSNSSPAFPSNITSLTIGEEVKEIPDNAFYGITNMTSVTISNSVILIGDNAFLGCYDLTRVEISDIAAWCGISFGSSASNPLYYAHNLYLNGELLTNLEIPNSVTSIGNSAFRACSGLTRVEIPNSVTSIGDSAFRGCSGLKCVEISDIAAWCEISFGDSYANPLYYAHNLYLNGELLTNLEIPNSVTSIGNSAFRACSGLTRVEIPNSVNKIGDYAFSGCNLTEIILESETPPEYYSPFSNYTQSATLTIPDNADISAYLLSNWRNFLNIAQENGDKIFFASDDVFEFRFIESLGMAYLVPTSRYSSMTSASIPDRVVADRKGEESFYHVIGISQDAFKGCSKLTQIKLPAGCKAIGANAFEGCIGLTTINIPSGVISIGNSAFEGCRGLTNIAIGNVVANIGNSAFNDCAALSSVDISDIEAWCSIVFENSLSNPLYYARHLYLNDEEVVDLKIPETVSSISDYAFYNYKGLLNLTIPNSVKTIGPNSFTYCPIQSLNIDCQNIESWFSGLTSLEILTLGENVSSIGESAFANCRGLKSVEIPNSVSSIGSYAFQRCSGLTNFTIPNSITSIGEGTFEGCSGLTNVEIPNSVTSIGKSGFRNCNGLTNIEIGNSVTSIGDFAFDGCSGLTNVVIPNSVTSIGKSGFRNCNGLTNIEIGNSVTSIGDFAFDGCSGLTNVVIPNSVTSIGSSAFAGCRGLTSIQIGNSVTTIGEKAFQDCSLLKSLEIPYSVISMGNEAFRNIAFDSFSLEDGVEILSWESPNNISATNLYVGRNTEGMITFSNIENLEIGAFVESIPANRFNKASLSSLIINPGSGVVIEEGAFQGCNKLGDITLPEDIAEIGANAFSGTALRNITVPNGIIGASAFAGCNLDNIIIGAGVESIGEKAFDGSNALNAVYATPTTPPMAENNTFSYYEAQLYVPEEAIDTYYNFTRCWYRFNGKPLVMPEKIVVEGPTDVKGKPGETLQLAATITPANVTLDRVLWRSTNTAVATVDNNGLVTFHDFLDDESLMENGDNAYCEIIASTLYEDSPVAIVRIEPQTSSIEYLNSEDFTSGMRNVPFSGDIYTLQGVCLKRGASQSDIDALAPGVYIIGGKKVMVK